MSDAQPNPTPPAAQHEHSTVPALRARTGAPPLLRHSGLWRTGIFLAVSLGGYVAANLFWQYLSTGDWQGLVRLSVWKGLLTLSGPWSRPLGEAFYRPLSILSYPWMIVVLGLALGLVILIPVIMGVLYRLRVAAAFVLVAALVGQAPVLALTLGLGACLAALTPLRTRRPLLAVLLGLLPVGLYLWLASYAAADAASVLPVQRWIPYMPMLVALAAAIVGTVLVLTLVRLTRYRPGAVWPAVVILLAMPVVIFYGKIGPAELEFSIIAHRLAGCSLFEPTLAESLLRDRRAEGLSGEKLQNLVEADLSARQRELVAACDAFLARNAQSSRRPEVLWVLAQARSLQVDQNALQSGTVRYTETFALPQSEAVWRKLAEDYPAAPQAGLANWRLAELALREQKVAQARPLLDAAVTTLRNLAQRHTLAQRSEPLQAIFNPPPAVPPATCYDQARLDVERLAWLVNSNRVGADPAAAAALAAYLDADPSQADYYQKLVALRDNPLYQKTSVANNIKLAIAKATSDLAQRVETLHAIAADGADLDAALEANYELGRLAMQPALARQAKLKLKPSAEYFKLVAQGPTNPWTEQAAKWLAATQPATGQ